jgi:hypothetical protein
MTVAEIVAELRRPPLYDIAAARATGGVPAAPGFYAWWAVAGALPVMAGPAHPSEPFELLYVGIAPHGAASSAGLRSRLCRQHIGGNVAASTFRLGLASLLWEREGWTPCRSASGRYRLPAADNRGLSVWQREHLRVRWAVAAEPWRLEAEVIAVMKPPMNRAQNAHHPFYGRMGEARARFRAAADED